MKPFLRYSLLGAIGILAVSSTPNCFASTTSESTNNPFADIAERNMFGLRKLPHIPPSEATKPPVNIKLTGFEKQGDQPTRVLLAEVPKDPKQQMKLFNLGVGEMKDGVEVLKIQPGQQAVDVVIDGVPEELTVKSNTFVTSVIPNRGAPAPPLGPGARRTYR